MQYMITGKNIVVTDGLRSAVTSKIGKLERYFSHDVEAHVTLSVEKDRQKIEVTIPVKGNIIRAEQESNDMYVSIDLVEEIIERQLKKYKNKIQEARQSGAVTADLYEEEDDLSYDRLVAEHKAITEAIIGGDEERAAEASSVHIDNQEATILEQIAKREV